MERAFDRDCTPKCRSVVHARKILSCIPSATPPQIRTYAVWMCHNFACVADGLGRNILHVAASCGKWEIVDWLIKQCCADVDVRDLESGWTALHRSFYYGQLASARMLCMNGASLRMVDHDGFSPLDIILKDRLPYVEYLRSDPCDVYAWGSNFNYNLGIGSSQSRNNPEVLEVFRKDFVDIQQVEICKFHSVFVSKNGKVYTCGYGHGGRLGQNSEDISLFPSLVKGLDSQICTRIATGQDHILFLLENKQVWSCGFNLYHQLGHIPPPERLLAPKPISLKFLKGKCIMGIEAARFHSVLYTKDGMFTFGLNAGQLGHPKGDRTQIHPRQVSPLMLEDCQFTHVTASDGATVCATSRGDIYVLHEYQIRKIASKQLEIQKLSAVGGYLDSRCDVAGVREGGGLELRVILLTKSGKVYLWRQTDPYLRRCLFNSPKELIISDAHINHYCLNLITSEYEAFTGTVVPFKGKRGAPPSTTLHAPSLFSAKPSAGLTVLLDRDDCQIVKVKKLPNIYRGTAITCDSKGRNFAVLQSNPKMGLIEIPMMSESKMQQDLSRLYFETHKLDDFHDIIIKVHNREFPCHKYILASRSDYFHKQFSKDNCKNGAMTLDNAVPEAFEQVLKFIYTNHCDVLTDGFEVKWEAPKENGKKNKSKPKVSNPILIVQELSKKLNLSHLFKRLEQVKIINGIVYVQNKDRLPRLTFNRRFMSSLCDVNVISSSGTAFACHKCILAARSDYFHSMLSTSWAENSQLGNLSLPISSPTMEALIEFLYTDEAVKVSESDDVEFLCNVLMIADQLLVLRLKEICEVALVRLVSLKNAAELLELSSVYNAEQMKRSCMQFICINLAAIIESKALEVVSNDTMEELSSYYRNLVPRMSRRKISGEVRTPQDLELLEKQFPISDSSFFEKHKLDSHEGRTKNRKRCTSLRSEAKNPPPLHNESVQNIVLDMSAAVIEKKPEATVCTRREEKEQSAPEPEKNRQERRSGQWVMKCPTKEQVLSLGEIMTQQLQLTPVQKKHSVPDMKPFPHLSQKQRKMLESARVLSKEMVIPNSQPNRSCPWGKLPQESPPSPSFWEAVAKKEFQSPLASKEGTFQANALSPVGGRLKVDASRTTDEPESIVISLHEIQKDEEKKLRRCVNPKIKPLHILNVEDQAIEELLELYRASDSHKEKVTVSRVQSQPLASPVWRRSGH